MVQHSTTKIRRTNQNEQTMKTDNDLIFAPRTFFCFSASAQVAHLVLPNTQTNTSQNQKSHFFPTPFLRQRHVLTYQAYIIAEN